MPCVTHLLGRHDRDGGLLRYTCDLWLIFLALDRPAEDLTCRSMSALHLGKS